MELGQIIIVTMVTFIVVIATGAAIKKYSTKDTRHHQHN